MCFFKIFAKRYSAELSKYNVSIRTHVLKGIRIPLDVKHDLARKATTTIGRERERKRDRQRESERDRERQKETERERERWREVEWEESGEESRGEGGEGKSDCINYMYIKTTPSSHTHRFHPLPLATPTSCSPHPLATPIHSTHSP